MEAQRIPTHEPSFDDATRARLRRMLGESRDPRLRDRCRAVLWAAAGRKPTEIAQLLDVHRTTVSRWLGAFQERGISGLRIGKSPGRPREIDRDGERLLLDALARDPSEFGYEYRYWTLERLRDHLDASRSLRVSTATLGRTLHRLGCGTRTPPRPAPAPLEVEPAVQRF